MSARTRGVGRRASGHFCYLLRSDHSPTHTYVGYSVDPHYRLRQHNGEVGGGARYTSARRPWRHVAIVRGFSSKREGLQFEWALKNPRRSRHLRGHVRGQCVTGPLGRLWTMRKMTEVFPWAIMNLEVEECHLDWPADAHPMRPGGRLPRTVEGLRRFLAHWQEVGKRGANVAADLAPLCTHVSAMLAEYDAAPEARQAEMRATLGGPVGISWPPRALGAAVEEPSTPPPPSPSLDATALYTPGRNRSATPPQSSLREREQS